MPTIDNADAIQVQKQNIALFQPKQLRMHLGFAGTFAIAVFGDALIPFISVYGVIALIFIGIFFTLISMFLYKCPHCGTMPSGVAYSVGSGTASYSKGAHPFPSRCAACGYYLSRRALEKDMRNISHDETAI